MNFTASPASMPRLAASPAFISRLYRAGVADEYIGSCPTSPAPGGATSAWISITSQLSPIHTKSSANLMPRIQNEDARPLSNTNSIPAPSASESLPDSPRPLSSGLDAISTANAAPPTDTIGRAPPPSKTIRGGFSTIVIAEGVAVGVGVGKMGVLVGAGLGVGKIGVLVGAGVDVGGMGVLDGAGAVVGGTGVLVDAGAVVGGTGVLDGAGLGVGGVAAAVRVRVGVGETVGAGDVVALGVGETVGAGDVVALAVCETVGVGDVVALGAGEAVVAGDVIALGVCDAVDDAIRAVGDAAAMLACAAVGRISADDVRSGALSQAASASAAASAVSAAAMSRRRPPRRALRKLHPRRAVSAALSRLRAETAHAAMMAQMLARHAPQDARAATVNHAQPRHPVPRGVV